MRRPHPILIALAISLAAPREAAAQTAEFRVIVHGSETGHGITRRRDQDCFVVTPKHVVFGRGGSTEWPEGLRVVDNSGRTYPVQLVYPDPELDVAILTLPPHASPLCAPWPEQHIIERAAETPSAVTQLAVLEGRGEDREDVGVKHRNGSRLKLTRAGFREGLSGGVVYSGGVPVGMVFELTDSMAVAYRLDFLQDHFSRFFRDRVPPNRAWIRGSLVVPGMGQFKTRRRLGGVMAGAAALGLTAGAYFYGHTETRTRTIPDAGGTPRNYPYQAREHPFRTYAGAIWIAGGIGSFWEARGYVNARYRPVSSSQDDPSGPGVAVTLAPVAVDGRPAAALTVVLAH